SFLEKKKLIKSLFKNKFFLICIFINFLYILISLFFFKNIYNGLIDFRTFFRAGTIILTDINKLYYISEYIWIFRYFPSAAIIFVPFSLLNFTLSYLIFIFTNFILNLIITWLIYLIISKIIGSNFEMIRKSIIIFLGFFLISFPNLTNYLMGQISLFIACFLLISLYYMLKPHKPSNTFLGGFFLGISLLIKPLVIIIIPFFLLTEIKKSKTFSFKNLLIRFSGILFPNIVNFVIFLSFPILILDFFSINFTKMVAADYNFSISITKLILNTFYFIGMEINRFSVLIFVFVPPFSISLLSFLIRKNTSDFTIVYAFLFGLVLTGLTYFDTWDHHFLVVLPFLIILRFILQKNNAKRVNISKKLIDIGIYYLYFLNFLFVILWFLIKNWFPWNFPGTIILVLLFGVLLNLSFDSKSLFMK
ncbi:MAG: DUF2029 domain-containing protein, partial [Promethearchaeota archaeon]